MSPSPHTSQKLNHSQPLKNTNSRESEDRVEDRDTYATNPSPAINDAQPIPNHNPQNEHSSSSTPTSAQVPPIDTQTKPSIKDSHSQPVPAHSAEPRNMSVAAPTPHPVLPESVPSTKDPVHNATTQPNATHTHTTATQPQPPPPHSPPEPHQQPDPFSPTATLLPYDFKDLESRFQVRMAQCDRVEEEIEAEFREVLSLFSLWREIGSAYEEERARKRLRTRTSHLRTSEAKLQDKKDHHIKVVQAFENALALLGTR
ncbi:hypothetical protein ACLMJK_006908 [Lecanora helva]